MTIKKEIQSVHLDVLKEIANIGVGHAATSLSFMLDKKVDMNVPMVKVIPFNEVLEHVGGNENIVAAVFLRIEGDISGNIFFLLPIQQGTLYVQKLIGDSSFSFDKPPYSEMGLSAMQELGNMMAGSFLSSLSDFTGLDLYCSVPSISIDMADAIISYGLIETSQTEDYAILIDTALNENDQMQEYVKGHFFLLPDPQSLSIIFQALGVKIDD